MQRRLNESTEKYKKNVKTAMNPPIMLKFQKREFRLRVSEKVPKGIFQGRPKASDLAESVRKNIIRQTSPQQKKWRMYNAGY